ncbi:MAG TPA: histidine phosphatase family protein [Caulobacteraceae bacterium]|nr:histidine phosphatase family protein [Caulobacteraceae bacterium]
MALYLIRHGKPAAAWGDDDDPGLDETGHAQARAIAGRLMALPEAERPRAVVSSPLRRCRETAQPLADAMGVELEIEPAVGEIPTPAALSVAQRPEWLRSAFTGAWADIRGDIDYEAWRKGVAEAVSRRRDTAIFSHFVAINAVMSVITGDDRVIGFRPDHTSMTTLAVEGGAITLVARGDEAVTGVL